MSFTFPPGGLPRTVSAGACSCCPAPPFPPEECPACGNDCNSIDALYATLDLTCLGIAAGTVVRMDLVAQGCGENGSYRQFMKSYWPAAGILIQRSGGFARAISAVRLRATLYCRSGPLLPEGEPTYKLEFYLEFYGMHLLGDGEGGVIYPILVVDYFSQLGSPPFSVLFDMEGCEFTETIPLTGSTPFYDSTLVPYYAPTEANYGTCGPTHSVTLSTTPSAETTQPDDTYWCVACRDDQTGAVVNTACVPYFVIEGSFTAYAYANHLIDLTVIQGPAVCTDPWHYITTYKTEEIEPIPGTRHYVGIAACEEDCGDGTGPPARPSYCVWCRDYWRQCSELIDETAAEICADHNGVLFTEYWPAPRICSDYCVPPPVCVVCDDEAETEYVYNWTGDTPTEFCAALGAGIGSYGLCPDCSCPGQATPPDTGVGLSPGDPDPNYPGPYGVINDSTGFATPTGSGQWLGFAGLGMVGDLTYTLTITVTGGPTDFYGFSGRFGADAVGRIYVDSETEPRFTTPEPPDSYTSLTSFCLVLNGGTHTVRFVVTNYPAPDPFPPENSTGLLVEWDECASLPMMMAAPGSKPAPRVTTPVAARTVGTPTPSAYLGSGPGTELARLIRSLGLGGIDWCGGCQAMVDWMNRLGVIGCDLVMVREIILARLRERAATVGWGAKLKAGVKAAVGGLILNPLDPAPGLLAEAIRRASARPG